MMYRLFKKYKTKKHGGQHYWVSRTRNFGSQIIRQRIRKDLQILPEEQFKIKKALIESRSTDYPVGKILPQTHRREEIIRVFEKNPEFYKEFRKTKPLIFFGTGEESRTIPQIKTIILSDGSTVGDLIHDIQEGISKTEGLEPKLRHEIRHMTDYTKNPKRYYKVPESLRESSTKSAEHISVRKHQLPRKIIEAGFGEFMKKND